MNLSEFFRKFRKGLFTKAQFVTGATISLMVTSALVWAFTHSSLTTFNQDEVISSTEMNNNFAYVKERLDKLAGEKFVIVTTSSQSFGTNATYHPDTYYPMTFHSAAFDISTHGQDYIDNGYLIIPETGFYELQLQGRLAVGTANYGTVLVAKKPVGVATYQNVMDLGICCSSTDYSYKGSMSSRFLNSGTTIQIRAGADKYSNGGTSMDIDATFQFSMKKL